MDIKITGITREIMAAALEQAREARLHILDAMNEAIAAAARRHLALRAAHHHDHDQQGQDPRRHRPRRQDDPLDHRAHRLQDRDPRRRPGRTSPRPTRAAAQQAVEIIKELTAEAELGKTYLGKVVRVVNFGAFVEILPGVEGLLHISEIADQRIGEVRDVLDEGDETLVKVIDIDATGPGPTLPARGDAGRRRRGIRAAGGRWRR